MSNSFALMAFEGLTEQDIVTIRETVAKDCNDSQFRLFMSIAKASGANPFLGEIHPSVFQGKLTVQYGVDFHVRKAKETEGYLGYDVQLVHDNDTFRMHQERAEDGRYFAVIDEHSWGFPRGKAIGGYAIAYKEGLPPFTVVMDVEEVEHYKKSEIGMQKRMWNNQFVDMFKKHMVKRALKAAFGLRFAGEEDRPVDAPDAYDQPPVRRDITDEVNATSSSNNEQQPKQEQPTTPPPQDTPADPIADLRKQMNAMFRELGISGKDAKAAFIEENANFKDPANPTVAELKGLLKIMDMHIAEKQAATSDDDDLLS